MQPPTPINNVLLKEAIGKANRSMEASKPLDRASGAVQSFEYGTEHWDPYKNLTLDAQKSNFWKQIWHGKSSFSILWTALGRKFQFNYVFKCKNTPESVVKS